MASAEGLVSVAAVADCDGMDFGELKHCHAGECLGYERNGKDGKDGKDEKTHSSDDQLWVASKDWDNGSGAGVGVGAEDGVVDVVDDVDDHDHGPAAGIVDDLDDDLGDEAACSSQE